MQISFHIGYIKANGVSNSSAICLGTNLLFGFASNSKQVSGNSDVNGDYCSTPAFSTYVDDQDLIDSPMQVPPPFLGS